MTQPTGVPTDLRLDAGGVHPTLWRELGALWSFGLREYRLWQSYRVNQLMWIANLFVQTLLFFLMGRMMAGHAAHLMGAAYGTNYMSFILVGITVNVFIYTNLSDPFTRVARVYFNGTMDLYLLSPMSIYTPLLGLMTKSAIDDYPRLFFTGRFGILLFGATFRFDHWAMALGFTALFQAAGFGIGLISASSFYLLNIKKRHRAGALYCARFARRLTRRRVLSRDCPSSSAPVGRLPDSAYLRV